MRYRITLSYDGTDFSGWQSQPNAVTVESTLEDAIFSLTGERTRAVGSGRTDAGVHALAQVAHFDCEKALDRRTVIGGLNAYLPRSVRVLDADVVPDTFDACRSAKKKTYMYLMHRGAELPVLARRALAVARDIDVGRMRAAAAELVGKHDFATFKAAGSGAKTSVRTVYEARIEENGGFIMFYITADGFLYNMVRIITAQLIRAGEGKPVDMPALIAARDRTAAKDTAPPYGLYLFSVDYGEAEDGGKQQG